MRWARTGGQEISAWFGRCPSPPRRATRASRISSERMVHAFLFELHVELLFNLDLIIILFWVRAIFNRLYSTIHQIQSKLIKI